MSVSIKRSLRWILYGLAVMAFPLQSEALLPQRGHICFFASKSFTLSERDKLIVGEAALVWKNGIYSTGFDVVGHASEPGYDARANGVLALQRAIAVRDRMILEGVPDLALTVTSEIGFLNLNRPFEHQNQFVEIRARRLP